MSPQTSSNTGSTISVLAVFSNGIGASSSSEGASSSLTTLL